MEGVTHNEGHVQAFNEGSETASYRENMSDRLHRYVSFGSLSYSTMAQPLEMTDMDGIFNEMRRDLGEIEGFDIYSAMALQLKPNGLLMVSPRSKPDRGWMANVKSRRCYCNYCDIIFAVPKAG